jgi:hypothetical protein
MECRFLPVPVSTSVSVLEKGPVADPLGPFSFWVVERRIMSQKKPGAKKYKGVRREGKEQG